MTALSACGSGDQDRSPGAAEDALSDYFEALVDGDADACAMETDSYRDEANEGFALFTEDGPPDCKARVKQMKALMAGFDMDLSDAKFEGEEGEDHNEAIVSVAYSDSEPETYTMVYEDGEWLVDSEAAQQGFAESNDGDGDFEGEGSGEDATGEVLSLTEGASKTLLGHSDSGQSEEAPFTVVFDTLTCAETIPNAGLDENFESGPLVADDGNQVCIVELEVTNDGKKPATFSSQSVANVRTTDGTEYSETDEMFDDQGFLQEKDRDPSYTMDEVQPGQTKYDVIAFELPTDAEPVELVYDSNEW